MNAGGSAHAEHHRPATHDHGGTQLDDTPQQGEAPLSDCVMATLCSSGFLQPTAGAALAIDQSAAAAAGLYPAHPADADLAASTPPPRA